MRRASALLVLACVGCSGSDGPAVEGEIPDLEGVRLERMYAVFEPNGPARFGSYDGAVAPGRTIEVDGVEVTGDANGRVALEVSGAPTVEVRIDGVTIPFTVRTPRDAREAAVHPAVGGTGDQPNDLLVADGPDGARAIVVRSGDHAVSAFDLAEGLSDDLPGVRLPRVMDEVAAPWFVAPWDDSGARFAVTAQKQNRVYVIDLASESIVHTLVAGPVDLDTPFTLARPFDLDGDGTDETTITRVTPQAPQPVLVHDGRVYVGYSGFVRGSTPALDPVYVPAVLAVWDLTDLGAPIATHVVPTMNTQELRVTPDGRIAAVSSGVIDQSDGTVRLTTEGAVDFFDPATGAFTERYTFGDFGPTSVLFAGDRMWVASLARARIHAVDLEDRSTVLIDIGDQGVVNSVFRLVDLGGGLIAAPLFNDDQLIFVDATTRTKNPPPFYAPIVVGAGAPVFDGLQIVAPRPGRRGVDFVGPDLYALSGLAARVTPVELRKLLGP